MASALGSERSTNARMPHSLAVSTLMTRPLPSGAVGELDRLERLAAGARVIYLSTPITTGPRYLAWRKANKSIGVEPDGATDLQLRADVISQNISSVAPLRRRIRSTFPQAYVIDPTELDRPEWEQADYHRFWLEVISRFAEAVVLAQGWEYSTGCAYEFASALQHGLPILDHDVAPLDLAIARGMLLHARRELQEAGLASTAIDAAAEAVVSRLPATKTGRAGSALKDDRLYEVSHWANVAKFASFDPLLQPRHVLLGGDVPHPLDVRSVIQALIDESAEARVNVRTFLREDSKGSPFVYGLRSSDEVIGELRQLAARGYYTIVNETIDVHDGGVSGVSIGGVAEFAPDSTPRAVEEQDTVQLPVSTAQALLSSVYSASIAIPDLDATRVEFSVHPNRVGTRDSHVCVWEVEDVHRVQLTAQTNWPNGFSRLIGDKCFGLLLADAYGASVPYTHVLARRVAPFSFGEPTGTGEWWLRTAPRQQEPGRFVTTSRWLDPYLVMANEDPAGDRIASVLSQEGVDAEFSGATMPMNDQDDLVEGVPGSGVGFMLGSDRPVRLPRNVVRLVRQTASALSMNVGPVRLEWAFDGERCWVLQMHRAARLGQNVLSPGQPVSWVDYDPRDGLEVLRALLPLAKARAQGVRVTRPIGITSHVGDLLRKAGVPGVFAPNVG